MLLFDKLSLKSKLRFVNAEFKFVFSIVTLLICLITKSRLAAAAVLISMGALSVKKGGVPIFVYMKLLTAPLIFLLLSSLAMILNVSKEPVDFLNIYINGIYITASAKGMWYAINLMLTAMGAVSCLYFLTLNTAMNDIIAVLNKYRCPQIMIELMLLIYRFIFVLFDFSTHLSIACELRFGRKDFKTSVRSFGNIASALMILAIRRSRDYFISMESRCYSGEFKSIRRETSVSGRMICFGVIFELILIAICFLENILMKRM